MNNAIYLLYVEDNEGDVELLKMSIERHCPTHNIILEVAETVEEAKELFQFNKHRTALLDWNLPDGEGIEVAEFIRSSHDDFPIFFLSGVFTDTHLGVAEKYKPIACLEKDYNKGFIEQILFFL
jgi:DNA-binding response OmpR family regulator